MLSETQKETRIQKLIETEWELFQHVHNEGGRAACQDDWNTFHIMRHSQFAMWPEKVLSSYQTDLDTAKSQGRNLITEKYARMMASTDPEEYRRLEPFLPALTSQAEEITEEILSSSHGVAGRIRRTLPSTFCQGPPPSLQRGHEMGHLRRNLSPGRASNLLCRNTAALSGISDFLRAKGSECS